MKNVIPHHHIIKKMISNVWKNVHRILRIRPLGNEYQVLEYQFIFDKGNNWLRKNNSLLKKYCEKNLKYYISEGESVNACDESKFLKGIQKNNE